MKQDIGIYLNDHLAGAAGGTVLVTKLAESTIDNAENLFFTDLKEKIERDRQLLTEMIIEAGLKVGTIRHSVGAVISRVGVWRMENDGLELGELGRFEMIELLAVGIHGKLLLWKTLEEVSSSYPTWSGRNFGSFVKEAAEQEAGIEIYRCREAAMVFGTFDE